MAELIIQIPDELADRLEPLRNRLPELLAQLLESYSPTSSALSEEEDAVIEPSLVYTEVLDFLLGRPTPEEIAVFKVSSQAQERLQHLLEKNREATLSMQERAELDVYEQLEHLMFLLKARAINSIN